MGSLSNQLRLSETQLHQAALNFNRFQEHLALLE